MIHNLFPIPIGLYKLDSKLTAKELSFLKNQKTRPNTGNVSSVDNTILKNEKLDQLRKFIESKVSEYFVTVYNPKNKIKLKITQSWVNYSKEGQYHHKHAHPNSFISGVFYVQADKEKDKIHFIRNDYQPLYLIPKEWNTWNSESWWFDIGTGDLILFPSNLTHTVHTVDHKQTRISLSFNTFPIGNLGEENTLTGLNIKDVSGSFS